MNCMKWRAGIALCVGGEVPASAAARVEQHLAECADCRALLDDLCADHALLAELREEPLDNAMLARLRSNVFSQVQPVRPTRLYWKAAVAAALILAVVLGWPRYQPKRGADFTRRVAAIPPATPRPAPAMVPVKHRIVRRHHRSPSRGPAEPLLVQLVTNDPNIVIYWIVHPKPQGD